MDFFSIQLPRGSDGCQYFAHPDTMPPDWSWESTLVLSAARWIRMKFACNRQHPTYDTPDTIFLECIFQVCVGRTLLVKDDPDYELNKKLKDKYRTLLNLPWHIVHHNLLTFVIGHGIHGQGMYTAWPVRARTHFSNASITTARTISRLRREQRTTSSSTIPQLHIPSLSNGYSNRAAQRGLR